MNKALLVILDGWGFGDGSEGDVIADDVLQFKKLVYEMRFDEVSARYGEFGSFFVGNFADAEKLKAYLTV